MWIKPSNSGLEAQKLNPKSPNPIKARTGLQAPKPEHNSKPCLKAHDHLWIGLKKFIKKIEWMNNWCKYNGVARNFRGGQFQKTPNAHPTQQNKILPGYAPELQEVESIT